jgi:cytochrome b561
MDFDKEYVKYEAKDHKEELAMWTLLVLIGLHACAALYHHFARHDDTLRRMLP